ncbi:RNA-binding protein NOB1 isoform X2 [Bombina bombina]|uniref:RNA-binding protein NOB1 isoform X2 n=1 Tax=Bombina bombina TaxID=8345 RepID=UPI00235A7417|nr:RNA-binding protein NOB1 isoform X2 [Bombina bombina]
MATTKVLHVVADSGAFLRNAALQDIGTNIYTVREVVSEIRDKETRRRLSILPYQLNFKEPKPEIIQRVTEFTKKTGDYPSLSAIDIKVLALTYQLEAEHVGHEHLKEEPQNMVSVSTTVQHPEAPVNVAGFHFPSKAKDKKESVVKTQAEEESCIKHPNSENSEFNSFFFWRSPLPSIEEDLQTLMNAQAVSVTSSQDQEASSLQISEDRNEALEHSSDDDHSNEEDVDDGDGWITPSNIKQIHQDMGIREAPVNVVVGCLTTDFAMQNVLIQMGLHVLSVDGMLIRQTRNYILRCHGCFKTTSDMSQVFCPNCGNHTLKKVAVSVNEDGSLHIHFSKNPKVLSHRGMRYSLPAPQGGKHASNPHLVGDQHFPQQRLSKKARGKTDVFNPDYIAGVSPFAENDIYSRAANLQIRDGALGAGRRRVNPNAPRKKGVKKR